jgi:2-succinyl-6-hydroxy-2,4-cyclohexadiene-1-carboxylate synthase
MKLSSESTLEAPVSDVLLLHGFTGAPSSWDAIIAALPGFRCVAPWLTGHGQPPRALEVDGFEAEVDRLASLAPEQCLIAGYSLGARLALGLLLRHPQRFRAAVLVSVNPGLEPDALRQERRERDAGWCRLLSESGLAGFVERWQAEPLFRSQSRLDEQTRAAERARRLAHTEVGLCHSLRVTGLGEMPSYWERLSEIRVSVSLLAGALDPRFCGIAEAVVGQLESGYFAEIPGAGHNLLLERPDLVASAISKGS